ncbi:unnamed protein product, partial [Tilletia caries]
LLSAPAPLPSISHAIGGEAASAISAAASQEIALRVGEAAQGDIERTRIERDQTLLRGLDQIARLHTLGEELRSQLNRQTFTCSRDTAAELVSRLEVVRHLLTDIVQLRPMHNRQ